MQHPDDKTTLYRAYDSEENLIYVGISCWLPDRIKAHQRHSGWHDHAAKILLDHFDSRDEALAAEKKYIEEQAPAFNVAHNPNAQPARRTTLHRYEYSPSPEEIALGEEMDSIIAGIIKSGGTDSQALERMAQVYKKATPEFLEFRAEQQNRQIYSRG